MAVGVRNVPEVGEIERARDLGLNHKQGHRQFVWVACLGCAKERWVAKGEHPRYCQPCYYAIIRDYKLGNHPNWKGGVRMVRGYRDIKISQGDKFYGMANRNGYVLEHRLVMARHLDRPLVSQEIVHHINGVRDDNRVSNLAITNHDEHEHYTLLKIMQRKIRELEIKLTGRVRVNVEV